MVLIVPAPLEPLNQAGQVWAIISQASQLQQCGQLITILYDCMDKIYLWGLDRQLLGIMVCNK